MEHGVELGREGSEDGSLGGEDHVESLGGE
jgi:hypothetical protein